MLFTKPFWEHSDFANTVRRRVFKAIILFVLLLFTLRLIELQIIDYERYYSKSISQAIKKVKVSPVRGNMYDRNGNLMVHNVPSFSITVTPSEFTNNAMPLLQSIVEMDSTEIKKIIARYNKYSKFAPIKILRDASPEIVAKIEEYTQYLPGVSVSIDSKRIYNFDCNMSHLLGYTREITSKQLQRYKYYAPGDIIGQNGIEQSYENVLHGRDGVQFIAVDKIGQRVSSFANGEKDVLASNGFDLNLAIDLRLQELSEKLLAGRRGAVVAIDPNNGEVLVFASKPDYDPRSFSGRIPVELYQKLDSDKSYPLIPRALQSQYPPGSTWKMFIALAALQEGIINENSTITCTGSLTLGNRAYRCHGGGCGTINVKQAIKSSCNVFFYTLGMRLGMERFEKYGKMFHFGEKTYIDLPNEKPGRLPTVEWLQKRDKTLTSFKGRLINYGIGQGEILTTPLQMAAYTAAIANGGTYYQPHVVRSIYNGLTKSTDVVHYDAKKIPIDSKYFEIIKDGMWGVVNAGGTGGSVYIPGLDVCGKTGTAQNSHGADHSWFISFAPRKNPKIAMCVFVENAGFGAAVAGPITRQILEAFFFPERQNREDINNTEINLPSVIDSSSTNTNLQPGEYIPD